MQLFGCGSMFEGRLPQVLAVIAGTMSVISDGMHYGWSAPAIPILESADTPVPIREVDVVWLENIYMLGGFAGLPFTIFCVDKFGRKKSILIAGSLNLTSWILIGSSNNIIQLYIARFLSGIAGNCAFVSVPMYIAEIAEQQIRGFLAAFIYLKMLLGIVVVYSVVPFVIIPVSSAVAGAFVLIQLLTFPFMPETPYFLLLQGKTEDARKSLQRLRSRQDVDKELVEISLAIERQKAERGRPIDLVVVPSNRKALMIMAVLNSAQHFSSISVMLMNMHSILGDAASVLTPNTAAIIFSVVMLVAGCASAGLVDKAGRKILLTSSSFLTGVSILILASYFAVKNSGYDISGHTWVPVFAVMLYAATFKYGLGMVPIVLTGELFPTSVKSMGMTLAGAIYTITAVITIYLYQSLTEVCGMHVPFFIFAGCCFFTGLFTMFVVPETKGKTLEEIQQILKGEKPTPRRSNVEAT